MLTMNRVIIRALDQVCMMSSVMLSLEHYCVDSLQNIS